LACFQARVRWIGGEDNGSVIGYLLYHFGFDSDTAVHNLHIVDLVDVVSAKAMLRASCSQQQESLVKRRTRI